MDHSKISSKGSKCNIEKIQEFKNLFDGFQCAIDHEMNKYLLEFDNELKMLIQRTSSNLLKHKMWDVFEENRNETVAKPKMSVDEGYLTGTSSMGSYISPPSSTNKRSIAVSTPNQARLRHKRRSRSACAYLSSSTKSNKKLLSHKNETENRYHRVDEISNCDSHSKLSRSKPKSKSTKASSSDRKHKAKRHETRNSLQDEPEKFLRWPKPGELVLSVSGSPLVAQVFPDNSANVNIPLPNGVIHLRPHSLVEYKPEIINAIEPTTLDEIKTLERNLKKILSIADKASAVKK